ncbi:MAG: efflux RND transporter periplasmic adaptor subunit, partial [Bacteroidales bacterium]|nr:efflux RND transporter periplasmic adaptor subunit [Bacteroidales bacterium]
NVKSIEASLKEAKDNLSKTSIYAPLDGTISKLNIEKGERVVGTSQFAGTEIMRISNLNEMEVKVEVNENDIIRVHLNDTSLIEVDAYPNRKFKGIVTSIANSSNSTSTSTSVDQVTNFDVKIRILSESYKDLINPLQSHLSPFRPGMSATVDIQTKKVYNVLSVPVQAVTTRADTTINKSEKKKTIVTDNQTELVDTKVKTNSVDEFVFVYNDGKVIQQKVKTGIQDNNYIEIHEGLKEKQEIVTSPYKAVSKDLKNGDKVKKINKSDLFKK